MGVNRTDYIIYGWKLPYKIKADNGNEIDIDDDVYWNYQNPIDDYILISDGMCGDYNVFGKLIAHQEEEWEGWDFVELSSVNFNSDEAKSKLKDVFNLTLEVEPHLFIFSHFS